MKFGMMFANSGPAAEGEYAAEMAQIVENAGIESLWAVEHVVIPSGYESEYPYDKSGRMPGGEDVDIPDPLVWLSYVAGATSTIRVATGILILPQRNPLILAKEVASIDRLSGGRMMLGIGVGWLQEEFEALGVPFTGRGRRTDEYVEVMRRLWAGDEVAYEGEFVQFGPVNSNPKPAQDGGVPIIVGGHSDAAARRAGRLGDGFFPGRGNQERLGELFEIMRASARDAGRDPDDIEITAGGAMDVDGIKRFADLGVERMIIPPLGFDAETLETQLGVFADDVMSKVG